jgi:hydroxymethylpyrimidine pyrophosphatase-like HAD family hydrolase
MDNEAQFLIALDLDGTSVRYDPCLEMDPDLMQYINSVRRLCGIKWVMNSDRYTDTMVGIARLLEPEGRPAAILSCQRFIHLLDGENNYFPFNQWNEQQKLLHKDIWDNISPFFNVWRKEIEKKFTIIDCIINDLVFAYMVPAEQIHGLRELMREFVKPWPDAQVSGNQEWTFILHSSFSKGRVLSKSAEILGLSNHNIIAIGDGINDISMLNGLLTPMVGCPANASREVIEVVTEAGGVVADSGVAAGTVQVLKHYLKNCLFAQ